MDLSALSTDDLIALKSGDLSKVSTQGLTQLKQSLPEPTSTPEDMVKGAASGLVHGLPTAIDVPAAALATGVEKLTGSSGTMGQLFQQNLGNGLNEGVSKVTGPEYQPQTEAGTLAKGAGMGIATLPLGGEGAVAEGVVPAVGRAAAAGAGATGGGQIGEKLGGTPGAIVGGLAGGLAGGFTPELMRKVPNPTAPIADVLQDVQKGYQEGIQPVKTSADFRSMAGEQYKKADALGGVLSSNVTNSFVDDATKTLVPQTAEGKMVAGVTDATKLADRIQSIRDRPLSLQAAQDIDEHLSDVMDDMVDPKTGILTKQGYKVSQLQSALRDSIENAPESEVAGGKEGFDALAQGRQLWSTQAKLHDIERIVNRAEMMDNPATGIKTGFRTLASNPAKLRGYAPDVQEAIKSAATTGILEDALKTGGSRLWSMVGGSVGGLPGSVGGFVGSSVLRGAAERVKLGQANKIAGMISGQEVPNAATRFGAAFRKTPTTLTPLGKPTIEAPNPRDIIRRKP